MLSILSIFSKHSTMAKCHHAVLSSLIQNHKQKNLVVQIHVRSRFCWTLNIIEFLELGLPKNIAVSSDATDPCQTPPTQKMFSGIVDKTHFRSIFPNLRPSSLSFLVSFCWQFCIFPSVDTEISNFHRVTFWRSENFIINTEPWNLNWSGSLLSFIKIFL